MLNNGHDMRGYAFRCHPTTDIKNR